MSLEDRGGSPPPRWFGIDRSIDPHRFTAPTTWRSRLLNRWRCSRPGLALARWWRRYVRRVPTVTERQFTEALKRAYARFPEDFEP